MGFYTPSDTLDSRTSQASNNLTNHLSLDEGQALLPPQMRIGQGVLVQTHLVENRGMNIPKVTSMISKLSSLTAGCSSNTMRF